MMDQARDQQRLRRWRIRRLQEDWSVRKVSEHARIPKSTIHDWWSRFQRKEWEGLVNESRRPHTIHRLPEATIHRIVQVRQQEGWCHEDIAAYLNQKENIKVSCGSAYTILKRNGLITKPYKPRKQRTFIRFQRAHPDSLWQTDIKYYGDHYLIAFLDDCSRYLPAASLYPEATTDNVLGTLEEALAEGRIPKQILSDHGTQYWSNDGPSRFTSFCQTHGIEHILGSTGKPTTQGKIERFWQTFELYYPRFNNLDRFREAYNHKPHRSLNYKTPAEIYFN
jgi:transposase InsO family protein